MLWQKTRKVLLLAHLFIIYYLHPAPLDIHALKKKTAILKYKKKFKLPYIYQKRLFSFSSRYVSASEDKVALVAEAQNGVIFWTFQSVTQQNAVCDTPKLVHKNFEHQRKWI